MNASDASPILVEESVSSAVTVWAIACAHLITNEGKSQSRKSRKAKKDKGVSQDGVDQDSAKPGPDKDLAKKPKKERPFSIIFFVNGELTT